MKQVLTLPLLILMLLAAPATAVEYQGKNIDDRRFKAQAYSYETGGLYDVQVQFKHKKATLYFENGGKETVRLKRQTITDPNRIEGYAPGPFSVVLADILKLRLTHGGGGNLEPPSPRPLEGFWSISLREGELD